MNMSMKNGFFFWKNHILQCHVRFTFIRPCYVSQETRQILQIGFFEAFRRAQKIPSHLSHWTPRDSGVFKGGPPQNEKHDI